MVLVALDRAAQALIGFPAARLFRFASRNMFAGEMSGEILGGKMITMPLRPSRRPLVRHLCAISTKHPSCPPLQPVVASKLYPTVGGQGSVDLAVDWKKVACEREEAKAVLVDFLRGRGVSPPLAARTVNKAPRFIAHLLSLLHSHYRMRYLSGRELTTTEIRSTLLPYLEGMGTKHKQGLVDVFVSFPDPPPPRAEVIGPGQIKGDPATMNYPEVNMEDYPEINVADYPQLRVHVVDGKFRPALVYFLKLGFPPEQVERLVSRFPSILSYSVDGKIQPVVDFLLGMGVSLDQIPKILLKRPQLFGCSVEENLKPSVLLLEGLGVEREKWARILVAFPHMLTYSNLKLQNVVVFLSEIGLSPPDAGKVLTKFPHVVGYSVEAKLKPMAEYFFSIGVSDVRALIRRSPQMLGLSLELNIKPTAQFFLELGFTKEEFTTLVIRFPQILGLNVENNIRPKWNYFRSMERSKSEVVDFPQYFGYSLEKRIQSRYEAVVSHRLAWNLNRMLSMTDIAFQRQLESSKLRAGNHVVGLSE